MLREPPLKSASHFVQRYGILASYAVALNAGRVIQESGNEPYRRDLLPHQPLVKEKECQIN
jgi:hypothetical protein